MSSYEAILHGQIYKLTAFGHNIHVIDFEYIQLVDVAHLIWKDKRYITSIRIKASKASWNQEMSRKTMMADSQVTKITKLKELLTKWCHKDTLAKNQLKNFKFLNLKESFSLLKEQINI